MADNKIREMNEIVSSPENCSKNRVSLLMEAAAQVGESVTFNDVDELGLWSTKLFTCEVKVGRLLKVSGTGPNKKTAKANAAEQAFMIIKQKATGSSGNSSEASKPTIPIHASQRGTPTASPSFGSPNSGSNPIGSLQEMCTKNNWSPPVYDLLRESGEAHTKTFIYECKIESLIAQGQGKTKKTAKKLSAENMLSMIGETPPSALSLSPGASSRPSRNLFRNFPDQGPKRSSSPVSFLSSPLCDVMEHDSSFEPEVKPSSFLEDITDEFCSSLEDKGRQSGFQATYHDLPEKGYSGNYLCFVRLNTKPPTVCSGGGPTKNSAHEIAAKHALYYLSTVCA